MVYEEMQKDPYTRNIPVEYKPEPQQPVDEQIRLREQVRLHEEAQRLAQLQREQPQQPEQQKLRGFLDRLRERRQTNEEMA